MPALARQVTVVAAAVNYTAVAATAESHLSGIDAKLGALSVNLSVSVSADHTVIAGQEFIFVDATSGPILITLLPVADQKRNIVIKKTDETNNRVTLVGNIDGATDPFFDGFKDSITLAPDTVAVQYRVIK